MRGFCKCDLCGRFYDDDDNEQYDGITMWWFNKDHHIETPGAEDALGVLGNKNFSKTKSNIPAVMDVCPECMERFANWIMLQRNENKSRICDDEFPMNKPE